MPALLARSTVRIFEKIPQERFFEGSSKILSIVGDSVGDGIVQSTAVSTMRTPAANRRTTVSCTLPPHDMSSRQCHHMHTCTLLSHAHCRHIHIAITYTMAVTSTTPSHVQRRHTCNAVTCMCRCHVHRHPALCGRAAEAGAACRERARPARPADQQRQPFAQSLGSGRFATVSASRSPPFLCLHPAANPRPPHCAEPLCCPVAHRPWSFFEGPESFYRRFL